MYGLTFQQCHFTDTKTENPGNSDSNQRPVTFKLCEPLANYLTLCLCVFFLNLQNGDDNSTYLESSI